MLGQPRQEPCVADHLALAELLSLRVSSRNRSRRRSCTSCIDYTVLILNYLILPSIRSTILSTMPSTGEERGVPLAGDSGSQNFLARLHPTEKKNNEHMNN